MWYIQKYELDKIFETSILEHMELMSFNNGELICSKGSELNYMFFLVKGKVKIYTLHDNGRSILLGFNQPLSVMGDVEFLTDYKIYCNVESVNESIFIAIDFQTLRKYACENTSFLKFIIKNLSHKLYRSTNATSINLLHPVESRLASYLLSISNYEENTSDYIEVTIPKLTEVAELLGSSYRHLNRIVNEFITLGVIHKKKSVIICKNIEKLKELSQGNIYED